jgi:hypothetical protein
MNAAGTFCVQSLTQCDWTAPSLQDERLWFAMPPLFNPPAHIHVSFSVRDQGTGESRGKLHLMLFRKTDGKWGKVVEPYELCSADHVEAVVRKTLSQDDSIVSQARRGDVFVVKRIIGGSGTSLHVSNFTMLVQPSTGTAGVQTCFIPWKGHAGHIYAGKWGIFGNDGHPQDDGDQKYDLDISWLDFGTCLGYPKQMLLFGEFVKGFPSWI